ncbi:hypothetical protein [Salinibacter sp.]|uniref:hypothetical protein n=1 Tax=Salinibacter sp. TaxID=2065818 RepID=UPI0021E81D88|nr:hypothetical protein [Salinibacter sp.]
MQHIAKKIQDVRDIAEDKKGEISRDHPYWSDNDARVTTFRKMINVCNSSMLSIDVGNGTVNDPDWWEFKTGGEIGEDDMYIYANEYVSFIKISTIQSFFSCTESGLRLILRGIDSNACNGGTDPFKNIYECLLRSKLDSERPEFCDLLDLFREVRNTVHNNGVYFHRSWESKVVTYKGSEFNFEIGEPIDFVTWEFISNIFCECVNHTYEVVEDDAVSEIEDVIYDPFSER